MSCVLNTYTGAWHLYVEEDFGSDTAVIARAFLVSTAADWEAACTYITDDKNYIIYVTGNVTGISGVLTSSFGSFTGTVSIRGGGSLELGADSSDNGSLLYLDGNQTVILRDVTLQGKDGNNASLVKVVNYAATLKMHSGAVITGNSGVSGGGVYVVNGGSFIMTGSAEISGNAAAGTGPYDGGGGVFVGSSGIFTMTGSAGINGNTSTGSGGGVYVDGGGKFTVSDSAEISGNTADSLGGGVYVIGAATFNKTGGTIYGDSDNDPDNDNATNNTSKGSYPGSGNAVYYNNGVGGIYYRNATLNTGDDISTFNTGTNWNE
jgi:hypothetical protein